MRAARLGLPDSSVNECFHRRKVSGPATDLATTRAPPDPIWLPPLVSWIDFLVRGIDSGLGCPTGFGEAQIQVMGHQMGGGSGLLR